MAKNIVLGWVVALIPWIAWAGQPSNPELCKEGKALLAYFEGIYGKKILAGYNVYPHTPDDYQQTGRQAAIWGRDIRWLGDVTEVVSHVQSHGYIPVSYTHLTLPTIYSV